ncbi:TetR/AcrR family transcriptional regulator [Actinocrispum wychmicini]|uniref:TetR family transcriptional regulator n=1 Tax=Actinocrispum wychmicini TaxID=1213861 RepID=A0A4R2IMX2_9PSEU|nr:TetR/AcrR family transcriptional regulator [Actinocrispum wychmicini]TCO45359.1 TetR family transcriptional regulator [Actinocrispum wychmicini]
MSEPIGRRERKKAQTRQALADAALRLFLDRGYDNVGVKEVADAADVAVTTLFKHFPSKEALVFDLDEDIESGLVAAVCDRSPGQSIPAALRDYVRQRVVDHAESPVTAGFLRMVEETPALREYGRRMWMRHETALARAIAEDIGAPADDITCAALARFALDAGDVLHGRPDPERDVDAIFALLTEGWTSVTDSRK